MSTTVNYNASDVLTGNMTIAGTTLELKFTMFLFALKWPVWGLILGLFKPKCPVADFKIATS